MSYDMELTDSVTGATLELDTPHHMRGGTYCVGGEKYATLNVTYNYYKHLARAMSHDDGVRSLHGKTAAESIPLLDKAIAALGNDATDDYWQATEGNVKRVLCQLRALAAMRPDGVWDGD